ncbi:Dbl homology domain-containing protein [Fennellomyces sp. T-0311]|nr:Dbl homology domain-containing protein [Fennellomyces sp. T-0311]
MPRRPRSVQDLTNLKTNSSTGSLSETVASEGHENCRHLSWTAGLRKKKHHHQVHDDTSFPWPKTEPVSPVSTSHSQKKWHLVQARRTPSSPTKLSTKEKEVPAGVTVDPPEPPPQLVAHPPLRRRSSCPCMTKCEEDSQSTGILSIDDVLSRSQPGQTVLKKTKHKEDEDEVVPARTMRLRRHHSQRKEKKALSVWKATVQEALSVSSPVRICSQVSEEKRVKYSLTRKFILRELYTTEVTFWNQLYFAKVMFHDALVTAISRNSAFARKEDADLFANLFDLLQFSAKLLQKLQYFQFDYADPPLSMLLKTSANDQLEGGCVGDVCIGKTMCDMALDMVVFLRCALDYKDNVNLLKRRKHNKGYKRYREKMRENRETRQFTMDDYLIIPIQRVARYNLLLTDLTRHTNPNANDYKDIVKAQKVVSGLASAMNYAQK